MATESKTRESIPEFEAIGIDAFTTTRAAGTFGLSGTDPVGEVMGRWTTLLAESGARGICVAPQVHGTTVLAHARPWDGFLRTPPADGHATLERGLALTVTAADCAPVWRPTNSSCISGRPSAAAATRYLPTYAPA